MRPALAQDYSGDAPLADAKTRRDLYVLPSQRGKSADFSDGRFSKHGVCSAGLKSLPAVVAAMPDVLGMGDPSEVGNSVVGSVEVDVVALFSGNTITDERSENDVVNELEPSYAITMDAHGKVPAALVSDWAKDHSGAFHSDQSPPSLSTNRSVGRSDSTKRGRFVVPVAVGHYSPLFCGRIFNSHRAPFAGLRSGL